MLISISECKFLLRVEGEILRVKGKCRGLNIICRGLRVINYVQGSFYIFYFQIF